MRLFTLKYWKRSHFRELEQRAEAAEAEVARSQAMLERDRRELVAPMKRAEEVNHFSSLIRAAIAKGYGSNHHHQLGGSA